MGEIYIMGARNPFRMAIDDATGRIFWGDVGPDGKQADPNRGPQSMDEWNFADSPGNYGWPYCMANNTPFMDYDFDTQTSGQPFKCNELTNNAPRNTGKKILPPARPAFIWYPYEKSEIFPELGKGKRSAMASVLYRYNETLESTVKLPAYYHGALFLYDWERDWIKAVWQHPDGSLDRIEDFLPDEGFEEPIDMKRAPDGSLYLLSYGKRTTSYLWKIEYHGDPIPLSNSRITNQIAIGEIREMEIYDLTGKKVRHIKTSLNLKSFKLQNTGLGPGIYWLRMLTVDGWTLRKVAFTK